MDLVLYPVYLIEMVETFWYKRKIELQKNEGSVF